MAQVTGGIPLGGGYVMEWADRESLAEWRRYGMSLAAFVHRPLAGGPVFAVYLRTGRRPLQARSRRVQVAEQYRHFYHPDDHCN